MIHCQKCKHKNPPEAQTCSQCKANLLPGIGKGERFAAIGGAILLSAICLAVTNFLLNPDIGLWIVAIGVVTIVMGFGLWGLFYKSPVYERYELRGKRHVSLDPGQAIADYGKAIELAPEEKAFAFLQERAKLFQKQGMAEEARADWQRALENVNKRIEAGKDSDLELHKKRAEIKKHLGMEDEYAMEMLGYTLQKEKTFKFQRNEIVKDMSAGAKKGLEEVARGELDHLRGQVMNNRKYGLAGHCAQCGAVVALNHKLECSNDPKHYKITNIQPTIKATDRA